MKKKVMVGNVAIGGDATISIQSMSNIDTKDTKNVIRQIEELYEAGCQIVRLAVYDNQAVEAFEHIKKNVRLPLVADIHFDYRLAIASMEKGADKIRINPGNIGGIQEVKKVVEVAKSRNVPIRIGVNGGSLEREILEKYRGVTADGIVESGLKNVKMIEDLDYDNLVVSLKVSDPKLNFEAYKKFHQVSNYPLHIGVTESGSDERGIIKSSVGIGALLMLGIGDTMRVSLTGDPVKEIEVAKTIISSAGLMKESVDVISCPTCGRTGVDLDKIVKSVEASLVEVRKQREFSGKKPIKVAVMGCEVNGPGEAKSADLGVACGRGIGIIFKDGKVVKKVEEKDIINSLLKEIENLD